MEKVVISQGICRSQNSMHAPCAGNLKERIILMNVQTFVMSLNLCKILTHYLSWQIL